MHELWSQRISAIAMWQRMKRVSEPHVQESRQTSRVWQCRGFYASRKRTAVSTWRGLMRLPEHVLTTWLATTAWRGGGMKKPMDLIAQLWIFYYIA